MKSSTLHVILHGGLGDVLLTTPTFKAIKEENPGRKIFLYCFTKYHRSILKNNPYVDKVASTSFWRNPIPYICYRLKWIEFFSGFYGGLLPTLFHKKNVKDIIAEMYGVTLKDDKVQIFLSDKEDRIAQKTIAVYKNPVIMHITSRTTSNQEWDIENWERLVASMPDHTFLQVGIADEKRVRNAVNLLGKTSIRETFGLIKYARSFVGVNSIYSHASNAFGIPGVVLWGPAQPLIWGHSNNVNIYKPFQCSPCLDIILSDPCPYGRPCMNAITVEEVRDMLLKQICRGRIGE